MWASVAEYVLWHADSQFGYDANCYLSKVRLYCGLTRHATEFNSERLAWHSG